MAEPSAVPEVSGLRAVAREDGERVLIDLADRQVTYAAVDAAADRLAQRLLDDLGPADHQPDGLQPRIGLLIDDIEALVVAVVAIERAAMVRVAIDPSTPRARQRQLIKAVGITMVLSDVPARLTPGVPVLDPLHDGAPPPPQGVQQPPGRLGAITFTSGSTGPPKAIMLRPSGTPLFLLQDRSDLRVGLVAAGSVAATLAAVKMLAEAGWTMVAYQVQSETRSLASWLRESQIQALFVVPTVLRQIVAALDPGEKLAGVSFVGTYGEATTWDDVAALRSHLEDTSLIFNIYAQTESGSIAMMVIAADTEIGTGLLPVGYPLNSCQISVVDDNDEPVAAGEPGEIVVRGANTAIGYWGEDTESSTVFFPQDDGTTVVRTGDLGRLGPDGLLKHLGRADNLVKVAGGNRVDLGDVEINLTQLEGVSDAAVTAFQTPQGETRLRAFVVADSGATLEPTSLRRELGGRLPRYSLPDVIEVIDELPRLSNGKLDRRSLPDSPTAMTAVADQPGNIHGRLAAIWREVLFLDSISDTDDFFDLGGDSLRAVGLVDAIRERLGVDLPALAVMEHPTLAAMAEAITAGVDSGRLVTIRHGASGRPILVAHDVRGNLFPSRLALVEAGVEQPIVGLRFDVADAAETGPASLEALAASYLPDIGSHPGGRPGVVFGLDSAAVLAFEVARQLAAASGEPPLLVITTGGPPPAPVTRARRPLYRRVGSRIKRTLRNARRSGLPAEPDPPQPSTPFDEAARQLAPLWRTYHRPERYSGPLLLLHVRQVERERVMPWADWVAGAVYVLDDHELLTAIAAGAEHTIESAVTGRSATTPAR